MSLDAKQIIADAIRETLDEAFEDVPPKVRIKHRSRIEGCHPTTVWRRHTSGRIEKPLHDLHGPYWVKAKYRADLEEQMLAEAGAQQ